MGMAQTENSVPPGFLCLCSEREAVHGRIGAGGRGLHPQLNHLQRCLPSEALAMVA